MERSEQTLEQIFERAFTHSASHQTLTDMIQFVGEDLRCDHVHIFENNESGFYRTVYEWHAPQAETKPFFYSDFPRTWIEDWKARLLEGEILAWPDLREVKAYNEELYEILYGNGLRSAVAYSLFFQGRLFGFMTIENVRKESLFTDRMALLGLRYVFSSLLHSDFLISQQERSAAYDTMTGTGNRLGLQNYLEEIDHTDSVGLVYCEVLDWTISDFRPDHIQKDQMILHAAAVLMNVFGEEAVYRVNEKEFLVVASGVTEEFFHMESENLQHLMTERNLQTAIGAVWKDTGFGHLDNLIRQANQRMFQDKDAQLEASAGHRKTSAAQKRVWEIRDKASISLYHSENFFHKGDQWLARIFDYNVLMVVVDINFFRLYNDIFGHRSGNRLLESVADSVNKVTRQYNGIGGYMGGDDFCFMIPVEDKSYETLDPLMEEIVGRFHYIDGFAPIFGVYLSANRQETAVTMYDRALDALSEIKGSYAEQYHYYNEEYFRSVRDHKILMLDAKQSLEKGEFSFYLQPQVNERTGRIIGAEALVRWNHNGTIQEPEFFLEDMEKSGFIYSLDRYIWEEVCRWQRSLLDRGVHPLPVSVNVSRVDFYFGDVAEDFLRLTEKYGVDPSLIGLEITETAFIDNLEEIRTVTERLHQHGFRIFMDDFGSGSSSLSMLYSLDVDGIKTDIRFLNVMGKEEKAASIMESVISMAHMIGLMVLAEGVETKEQRELLISMGDTYAQGYYFYKPMPVEEYERLLADHTTTSEPPKAGDLLLTSRLQFRNMMIDGVLNDTMLDNIIGPAAVYREEGDTISIVQMNEAYFRLTGIDPDNHGEMERFIRMHYQEDAMKIRDAFHHANHALEGSYFEGSFWRVDGTQIHLRGRIFLLYSFGDHKLYMSTIQQESAPEGASGGAV